MKYLDILNLAHIAALDKWYNAHKALEEIPENEIRINREQNRWKDLIEIERLINAETDPT